MDSAAQLRAGLERLPQELRDIIFNYTFTSGKAIGTISYDYRPPRLLQVNRSSRQMYARSYYGGGLFRIHERDSMMACLKWLSSLPQAHLDMLTGAGSIKILLRHSSGNSIFQQFITEHTFSILKKTLRSQGVRLRDGVLCTEYWDG